MEFASNQKHHRSSSDLTNYKAWKNSPPPKPSILAQQRRQLPLLRQVSDEAGGESFEPSFNYTRLGLSPRHQVLHRNERRPDSPQPIQHKPSKPSSSRKAHGVFAFAAILIAVNLIKRSCFDETKGEASQLLSDKEYYLRRKSPSTYARVLYLDKSYSLITSPYFNHQARHRKIIDMYPAEYTDATQLYSSASSNDVRLQTMERKFFPNHETNPDCVPMSEWQSVSFSTCNSVHEMEMTDHHMLASGSWRDTWLRDNANDKVIVKTIKYKHTFQERFYEFSRVDALAMERLTSHPYIMSIHGFCGVSVITEMGSEKIGPIVNKLEPRDKLIVAMQVAESVAAVHEIDGVGKPASLVHNDINLDNVFWGASGPLLNDFNIAVLMMKNKDTNERCPFTGHFPNPQWKSPEEQSGPNGSSMKQLNEKVDVYALGNLLFQFATGKAPWRDFATNQDGSLTSEEKDKIADMKAGKGAAPKIPDATLEFNDPYINVILKAMKKCYRFHPEERPSAREIVRFLEKSVKLLDDDSK